MTNDAAIEAIDDGETPSDSFTVTVSDGDGPAVGGIGSPDAHLGNMPRERTSKPWAWAPKYR